MTFKKLCYIFVLFLFSTASLAAAPDWHIIPSSSSLNFIATQSGAYVAGEFRSFTGNLHFDPDHLDQSSAKIIVDMGSVTATRYLVTRELKSADFFDVARYPQAIFTVKRFIHINAHSFIAEGMLQIRDRSAPVRLRFTLDEFTANKAHATGVTVIKRSTFGVGSGQYAKTDDIKDDVTVRFSVTATR